MGDPRELYDYMWLEKMTGTVQLRPNGVAEAGNIYPAPDGHRFFFGVYDPDCVYILVKANPGHIGRLGKFFLQDRFSFAGDVSQHGYAGELSTRLAASKTVISGFLDIFMGVLSVTSGPLALGITGMNLLVAGGKIKRNYEIYARAMEVLLYNREFIRTNAPTLYGVVMVELAYGQLEKMISGQAKDALLNAVPGPKVAGKIVGVLLGKFGEDEFKERLKILNELFKEVLIKVAEHASTNWPKPIEADQVQKLAYHHVVPILSRRGILKYMDQKAGEKIVAETAANCLGLKGPLKKISAALDVI